MREGEGSSRRKPPWLKTRIPGHGAFAEIRSDLRSFSLHTVCEEARCPNRAECWASRTATFLILGDTCTRACRFCAVRTGNPHGVVDKSEAERVASAVASWDLRYVVLTSVDRDDLPDGGAAQFARTVRAVKAQAAALVEVLVPDFSGREVDVDTVLEARPRVFAHNLEVVERLTPLVRDRRASFARSLAVLSAAKRKGGGILVKSSLMLGIGETEEEVRAALRALHEAGVDIVTLGQYLQPTQRELPVAAWVTPDRFAAWALEGEAMGIPKVFAGPLVRSSYRAVELLGHDWLPGGSAG
jgi:lipoyl synthase